MIFNLMKPVPVAEVSPTLYLYGHEADKTVSYNGVVLPDIDAVWTDKETYPYAYIMLYNDSVYYLKFASSVQTVGANGHKTFAMGTFYKHNSNAWEKVTLTAGGGTVIWSNENCYYGTGSAIDEELQGTLYLSASDPVYTYETADVIIDGVGYYGWVLPKLPVWDKEAYPYVYISMGFGDIWLFLFSQECMVDGYALSTKTGQGSYITYVADPYSAPREWAYSYSSDADSGRIAPFWCNKDLYNKDGTLYLEGSEPVPMFPREMYLYNDTVLPALPDWDKETYPYATIVPYSLQAYHLVISKAPLTCSIYSTDTITPREVCQSEAYNCCTITCIASDKIWRGISSELSYDRRWDYPPTWTNYDIVRANGEVMKATEPIPFSI